MVSFHCDGCTDVVKKQKLDHHYGRCRASFTCIDCSATFPGPAQWKGHTTCVTEAEKYQKSLYKGPKKGSQPGSRDQENARAKNTHATGKYHQSYSNQGRSRPQYVRNCASGANTTPLGSPHRMSPVDLSAVEPSSLGPAATAKLEHGTSSKQNPEVVMENHTSNGTEPKVKKRKMHDREDATADKTSDVASEQLQNPPSKVNSPQKHKGDKKSRDSSQPEAQTPTEGAVPEKSANEKKVKKRKKERLLKPSDATEETTTQRELLAPDADEKKAKKRKRKEKQVDGAPPKQGDATEEATAQLEPVTRPAEGEEARASVDEAAPGGTANEEVKKSVENDCEKPKKKRRRSKAVDLA